MSRGDTVAPRRSHFNEEADASTAVDRGPRRLRYACKAHQCPMPGTIFLSGPDNGICAWHYGSSSDDLPRITRSILDWQPLADAINDARHFSNDPTKATSIKGQTEAFRDAWARLVPFFAGSGWKTRIAPRPNEHYGDWGKRVERFLGNRIKETLSGHVIADDDAPTPTVADMLTGLRGPLRSAGEEWDGP